MDCKSFIDTEEFKLLVPDLVESGMRILTYEPKNWYEFVLETQQTEQVGPNQYDVRDGYNKQFYEGFYGYINWYWGNTFTYGDYSLTTFYKKNEINIIYFVIRKTKTPEDGCLYKAFLRDAFDTRCCPRRGWI